MNILQSWKASLSIFAPANFLQFMKDIARAIFETYKVVCTQWRLMVVVLAFILFYMVLLVPSVNSFFTFGFVSEYGTFFLVILLGGTHLLSQLFVSQVFAAARPSTGPKNNAYFRQCVKYIVRLSVVVLFFD